MEITEPAEHNDLVHAVPVCALQTAHDFLSARKELASFKAVPYSEVHRRLSIHLREAYKLSFKMETVLFFVMEKIAQHGINDWNMNPKVTCDLDMTKIPGMQGMRTSSGLPLHMFIMPQIRWGGYQTSALGDLLRIKPEQVLERFSMFGLP